MSLNNLQSDTLMMSNLIEMRLLLDRKTVQDSSTLRVKVLHTRIQQNIQEMERSLLEIMQQEEIERCVETFRMEMEREKDRLHQNQQTSIQLKDVTTELQKSSSQQSDDISVHCDKEGDATCLLCNYNWDGYAQHICR